MESFTKRYSANSRETGNLTIEDQSAPTEVIVPRSLRQRGTEVNGEEERSASWVSQEGHQVTSRCEDADLGRVISYLRTYIERMRLKR